MMNKKFVLSAFIFFIFTILLTGFASAATITFNPDTIEETIGHGQKASVSFQVSSNELIESLILDIPEITGIDFDRSSITLEKVDTTPQDVKLEVTVGNTVEKGVYTGTIIPQQGEGTLDITITVPESKSLIFQTFTEPTLTTSGSFILKNTGNTALDNIAFSKTGNIELRFTSLSSPIPIPSLSIGSNSEVTMEITNKNDLRFGSNPTTITARASDGTFAERQITIEKTFCSDGEIGNLRIKDIKIDNTGDGKDGEWELLDTIEIEVEIENIGDDDIDDVVLVLGFFDDDGSDLSDEFDWTSTDDEKFDLGDVRDGDEETHTFKFRIPADFAEIGADTYSLAIKAYSDDLGEEFSCVDTSQDLNNDYFETIDIILEDDDEKFIIIDDIIFNNDQLICGETASGEFTVYNVGDEEQERVKITMRNDDLNLNEVFEITNDMDIGESETLDFSFKIPTGIEAKNYFIEFIVDYEYDDGIYETRGEERFIGALDVLSCGTNNGEGASIITTLDSDVNAGEQINVRATITNTGSSQAEFRINALGYQSWATLSSISPDVITLGAGESRDIIITLNADEQARGDQTLLVQAVSENSVDSREVEVSFPESRGFTGFSIADLADSGYVWLLILINVILIILIIVVAVRLARR